MRKQYPRLNSHIQDLLSAILRRKRIIILSIIISLSGATLYIMNSDKVYTATAVLATDTKVVSGLAGQNTAEPVIDQTVVESQIEILKSEKIALDVVKKLSLDKDSEIAAPRYPITHYIVPFIWGGSSGTPEPDAIRRATEKLLSIVRISRSGRSFLAEIRVTTKSPIKSARIANTYANAYIQDQLNSRMDTFQQTSDWMQQRLSEMKDRAEQSAKRFDTFTKNLDESHHPDIENNKSRDFDYNSIKRLTQKDLNSLLGVASQVESILDEIKVAVGNNKVDKTAISNLISYVNQNKNNEYFLSLLTSFREGLGEKPADLTNFKAAVESALAKNSSFQEFLRLELSTLEMRERLEAASRLDSSDYESLKNRVLRLSTFLQQQSMPVTAARIITSASPPLTKSGPQTAVVLILAAIFGVTVGCMLALAINLYDNRVWSESDVSDKLCLPLLATIPASSLLEHKIIRRERWRTIWDGKSSRSKQITTVEQAFFRIKAALQNSKKHDKFRAVLNIDMFEKCGVSIAKALTEFFSSLDQDAISIESLSANGTHQSNEVASGIGMSGVILETFSKLAEETRSDVHDPGATLARSVNEFKNISGRDSDDATKQSNVLYILAETSNSNFTEIDKIQFLIDETIIVVHRARTKMNDISDFIEAFPPISKGIIGVIMLT